MCECQSLTFVKTTSNYSLLQLNTIHVISINKKTVPEAGGFVSSVRKKWFELWLCLLFYTGGWFEVHFVFRVDFSFCDCVEVTHACSVETVHRVRTVQRLYQITYMTHMQTSFSDCVRLKLAVNKCLI